MSGAQTAQLSRQPVDFFTTSINRIPSEIVQISQALASSSLTKSIRSRLWDIVHDFRKAHGFDGEYFLKVNDPDRVSANNLGKTVLEYNAAYAVQIERFCGAKILPATEDQRAITRAIRIISQPANYATIAKAGRMRYTQDQVTPRLKSLCREVRAALVWSANQEGLPLSFAA